TLQKVMVTMATIGLPSHPRRRRCRCHLLRTRQRKAQPTPATAARGICAASSEPLSKLTKPTAELAAAKLSPGTWMPGASCWLLTVTPRRFFEAVGCQPARECQLETAKPRSSAADEGNEADEPTVAATELFRLPDGVRLFFVASDGRIRHGGSNSSLSLFVFDDAATASEAEQSQSAQPPAFITVGSHWRCPLIPGVTPVLASASGALIFPDLEAQDEASSVGVMLPEGLDTESRFLLLDLLACLSRLGIERQPEAPEKPPPYAPTPTPAVTPADADADQKPARRHTSDHLVTGIGWTAARMCEGAVAGGRLAGDLLTRARLAAQKRMRPAAAGSSAGSAAGSSAGSAAGNSNESANLDHVTTGVRLLRQGSAVGVRVSRRLVSGLVSGAGFLASRVVYPHAVAPALNAVGVSTSGRGSRSRLAGAARVAGAALSGASDVWESLGAAGSQLATCAADNGQALATHRWGDRAGAVTGDALHAGGNVARIAWATNALGVRAALKVVAMETGKEAVGRMAESDGAKAASAASGSAPSTGAKR
ncbi:hypothetical protein BOX15_Mlig023119g5, partial [Macrostomum lignano]